MTTADNALEGLEARLAQAGTDADTLAALPALVWELRTVDRGRALALSADAVRLARASGSDAALAPSLCLHGVCLGLLSRHAESADALQDALTRSRAAGDTFTEARCRQYLGRVHFCLAEYAPALEHVLASLQLREAQEDEAGQGACFSLMGLIYFQLCDFAQALDWQVRGLEVRERAGDGFGIAESLSNIGIVYLEMEDYGRALHYHERSLTEARRTGKPRLEMLSLCNLGGDFCGLGRFEEALEASCRAVALGEALNIGETVAAARLNLGYAYAGLGRQGEALDCFAVSLRAARAVEDKENAAKVLFARGTLETKMGELTQARASLVEAAALAESIGARRTAAQTARALSEVCKRQGDYAAALGHHEMFRRVEREIFTEQSDKRAQAVAIGMEVAHHRREAEALAEANAALQESNTQLEEANARLQSLATTDPLTGLLNHRALVAALDAVTDRARRDGQRCALLFLDIDHFKRVNDTWGHPTGDAVLREFALRVRACLGGEDTLGRWGGEEFLVLLPGQDAAGARDRGERVRAAVAAHPLAVGAGLAVTCSVGAAACGPSEAVRDILVARADQALYAAKHRGRNQVCLFGDPALKLTAPPAAASPPRRRRSACRV